MTAPQFSRPGAVDLSALGRRAAAAQGRPGAVAGAGPGQTGSGAFAFDVDGEQQLRSDVVQRSMSVVVLVSFWSAESPESVQINEALGTLSDEFGGRFLLARLDVAAQPQLAQALGIPEVPLVVAALRGQLAPLIQDPLPIEQMRSLVDQVLQAAAANGISGVAEPLAEAEATDEQAGEAAGETPTSRHPEADAALLAGDLPGAIAAYRRALSENPGDSDAQQGLARAELMQRTSGADVAAARKAAADDPDDVAANILVADLDLLGGNVDDALGRLVELVRRTRDEERETTRQHLLGAFLVVGEGDPRVAKARQALANALF